MKAVDLIVEHGNQTLFIEFKDPDHPSIPATQRSDLLAKIQSGGLDHDLKTKYRDTWIYEKASGRGNMPISYLVLISSEDIGPAELMKRTEQLKRILPLSGPGDVPWAQPFVSGCAVMNISSWNRLLPYPAQRLP